MQSETEIELETDYMAYQAGMEHTDSDIMTRVLELLEKFNPEIYTEGHVLAALDKKQLDFFDFGALLSPIANNLLEPMAARAKKETARYFGNGIRLFTPLYLANFCVNHCEYCGFSDSHNIKRGKLTLEEVERELKAIAATGLDEILLLTGESREKSDVDYIGEAIKLSAQIFSTIGIEIYPLNTDEYAYLRKCGADFVNIYQETYTPSTYYKVHISGPKRSYPYRFNAQERALKGGMRGVSFGALLGLGDFRKDTYGAGLHGYFLQKKYPQAEISFSVPRIRIFETPSSQETLSSQKVNNDLLKTSVKERQLLQVMLAYRLFMPFAGITISTRERAGFRDNVMGLCATKASAEVMVGVGGHDSEQKGDEQFKVADTRSVKEIHSMLYSRGLQPIYTDYILI